MDNIHHFNRLVNNPIENLMRIEDNIAAHPDFGYNMLTCWIC